jgi:hypothetical protein
MARVQFPLDPAAAAAANEAVRDRTTPPGRRLDPTSPADASLRVEWMAAYAQAGGAVDELDDDASVDDPVMKCCCGSAPPPGARPADYVTFRLVDASTDEPIGQLGLRIGYPDGSVHEHVTDANGTVSLPGKTGTPFTLIAITTPHVGHYAPVSTVQRG